MSYPLLCSSLYTLPIEDDGNGLTAAVVSNNLSITGVDAEAEVTITVGAAAASAAVTPATITMGNGVTDLSNIAISGKTIEVSGAEAKSVAITAAGAMSTEATVKAGETTPVTVTMVSGADKYIITNGSTEKTTVDGSAGGAFGENDSLAGTFTLKTANGSATVEAGKIAVGTNDATLGAATAGGSATFSGSWKGLPDAATTLNVTDGDTVDISGATLNSKVISFALSTTGSASTVTMTGSQFAAFTGSNSTAMETEEKDTIILTSAMTGDDTIRTLTDDFAGTLKGTGDLHVSGPNVVDFSGAKALEGFTGIVLSQGDTPASTTVKLTAAQLHSLGKVVADDTAGGIQDVVVLKDALNTETAKGDANAATYTLASTVSNQVQIKLAAGPANLVTCSANGSNIDASADTNGATITLGAGADTIKLGGTKTDTVAMNATTFTAGDSIADFTTGGTNGDVLNVKDFVTGLTKAVNVLTAGGNGDFTLSGTEVNIAYGVNNPAAFAAVKTATDEQGEYVLANGQALVLATSAAGNALANGDTYTALLVDSTGEASAVTVLGTITVSGTEAFAADNISVA